MRESKRDLWEDPRAETAERAEVEPDLSGQTNSEQTAVLRTQEALVSRDSMAVLETSAPT